MSVDDLYQKGFDARCNGDYGTARQFLEQALRLDPNHADSQWQMGLIQQFSDGDFDGSAETLKKVVIANPSHLDARYDLAMTFMMLGMQDEACEQLLLILQKNPNHEKAKQQAVYC